MRRRSTNTASDPTWSISNVRRNTFSCARFPSPRWGKSCAASSSPVNTSGKINRDEEPSMPMLKHSAQHLLENLDGFRVEIDPGRERADVVLDRPPFNIV